MTPEDMREAIALLSDIGWDIKRQREDPFYLFNINSSSKFIPWTEFIYTIERKIGEISNNISWNTNKMNILHDYLCGKNSD